MTKFNLSIDLFTESVRDAADVAQTLRRVAHDLAKMSPPWRPLALSGRIYDERSDRCIGTWSVDTEGSVGVPMIAAENDPVSVEPCGDRSSDGHVCSKSKAHHDRHGCVVVNRDQAGQITSGGELSWPNLAESVLTSEQSTLTRLHQADSGELQRRIMRGEEDDQLPAMLEALDAYFAMCRAKLGHDRVPIGIWDTYVLIKQRNSLVTAANEPLPRAQCLRCGEHVRIPRPHKLCPACASREYP